MLYKFILGNKEILIQITTILYIFSLSSYYIYLLKCSKCKSGVTDEPMTLLNVPGRLSVNKAGSYK